MTSKLLVGDPDSWSEAEAVRLERAANKDGRRLARFCLQASHSSLYFIYFVAQPVADKETDEDRRNQHVDQKHLQDRPTRKGSEEPIASQDRHKNPDPKSMDASRRQTVKAPFPSLQKVDVV